VTILRYEGTGFVVTHVRYSNFIRGPFEKFVDCRQCAAVMQREVVTVMTSCSGWGNVALA
jgi:hypothetical protein